MADHGAITIAAQPPAPVPLTAYSVPVAGLDRGLIAIAPPPPAPISIGSYMLAGTQACPPDPEVPTWGQMIPRRRRL